MYLCYRVGKKKGFQMTLKKFTALFLGTVILCTVFLFTASVIPVSASSYTIEYRGFESDFTQFGFKYDFVSGLPSEPYQVTGDTHTVQNIIPKFDDMNFRDYTFDGWNLMKKGGVIDRTKVYRAGDVITGIKSDMQLIAIWKRKEADVIVYSMHAYLRGGNGDPNIIEGKAPETKLLQIEDTLELVRCPYTYDGYKFVGWLDSKGNLYEPGETYTVENYNALFTAEWAPDSTAVVKNSVTYKPGASGVSGKAPNSFKLYNKNTFTVSDNTYTYDGYKFKNWNDGVKDYKPGDTYTVSGSGDIELHAVWEKLSTVLTVNVTSGPGGSVSPTGSFEINQGDKLELNPIPDEGYTISSVEVNGMETALQSGKLVVNSMTEDLNIVVEFKKLMHKIRIETDGNGDTNPSDEIEVLPGGNLSITLTPKTGYVIDKVLVDGSDFEYNQGMVRLKEINASHVVTVSFKKIASAESVTESETSTFVPIDNKTGGIVAIVILITAVLGLVALYAVNENKKKARRKRRRK